MAPSSRGKLIATNGSVDDEATAREFLATLQVGDVHSGTVSAVTQRHEVSVVLDGFPARPLGTIFSPDLSWQRPSAAAAPEAGQRITAELMGIDLEACRARLSMTASAASLPEPRNPPSARAAPGRRPNHRQLQEP